MSSFSPDLALAYLRELSADFRAGIALDAGNRRLAGAPGLLVHAVALLGAHPHARELHGVARSGDQVFGVRDDRGAIVVVTGPHALGRVTRRDLRTALHQNASASGQDFPCERPDPGLVNALTTAAADAFRP